MKLWNNMINSVWMYRVALLVPFLLLIDIKTYPMFGMTGVVWVDHMIFLAMSVIAIYGGMESYRIHHKEQKENET